MTSSTATLIGFAAILMWSLLSLLTVASGTVPLFQLAAMTFAVGGGLGAASWAFRPGAAQALRQPWQVWALGVGGLFGYHALFFFALRLAPPAEAQLVNYFWPLFIVLGSALLPNESLKVHHIAGALVALGGTVLLFFDRGGITFASAYLPGFACAFGAALTWAVYSVLSRRFAVVPTDAVAGFCLGTAALAAFFHLAFETTQWPLTTKQWLAVVALGVAPVGVAFYAWDIGVKRGDIRILGVGSYLAPLLSTLFLVLAGYAAASWSLALAAALVAGGGILAAKDMIKLKEQVAEPQLGDDVRPIENTLHAVIAWAASRPDILGAALIGSWARGEATASSDVDLMFIAVAPDAFRENDWPNQIGWAAPVRVIGSRDAAYGVVWSRHVQLSGGPEIEFSFADQSWAATNPVAPSTLDVVRGGLRILVDKQRILERLQAAARI
jgi:drug/metabolite transporter (DMT)-like permease